MKEQQDIFNNNNITNQSNIPSFSLQNDINDKQLLNNNMSKIRSKLKSMGFDVDLKIVINESDIKKEILEDKKVDASKIVRPEVKKEKKKEPMKMASTKAIDEIGNGSTVSATKLPKAIGSIKKSLSLLLDNIASLNKTKYSKFSNIIIDDNGLISKIKKYKIILFFL